ncbi:MAG TPA: ABC transporter ATP-binding protein [Rhizomicrobium sp.]|nr:ABC transporter ATP-binding protein [Rhizomicrobium sp.]
MKRASGRDSPAKVPSARFWLPKIAQLAGAHIWSFPLITILGVLSSLAESFGVGLIILFLYSLLGRQADAASAGGFLGSVFLRLSAHLHSTTLLASLIFAAIAAKAAFTAAYSTISSHVQNGLARDVRDRIHRQYLDVDYDYIRQQEEGEMLKMLATDSWTVSDAYQSVSRVVINAVSMVVMIGFLLLISWPLTLIMLAGSTLLYLALNRVSGYLRRLGRETMEINRKLAVCMLQTLQGMRAIRAFGQEGHHQKSFEKLSADAQRVATQTATLFALFGPVSDSGYLLLIGATLILATKLAIPTAAILTCVILLYRIQWPFRELQSAVIALAEKEAALQSVADLLDRRDKRCPTRGSRPFRGLGDCIEFRDVEFSYAASAPNVLEKASFRIPAGRTTVLVGASGAGKTTIVNLLLRLDEPSGGKILADGMPLDELDRGQWLKRLAAAGQDIELIDSTIDANIRIARAEADPAAVREAVELADFLDVVNAFPDGMQHWIGPQGGNLSGGQRQRLGLARAILRDPDILVLDEATSALDDAIERTVQRNLRARFKGRTILIVTHRASTMLSADHLIFLEGGRVTAEGAPTGLLPGYVKETDHLFQEHFRQEAATPNQQSGREAAPAIAIAERRQVEQRGR